MRCIPPLQLEPRQVRSHGSPCKFSRYCRSLASTGCLFTSQSRYGIPLGSLPLWTKMGLWPVHREVKINLCPANRIAQDQSLHQRFQMQRVQVMSVSNPSPSANRLDCLVYYEIEKGNSNISASTGRDGILCNQIE
jgi:hypothetical protein